MSGPEKQASAASEPLPAASADVARSPTVPQDASTDERGSASLTIRQTDCGNFGIHISRDGTWWYHGSPIRRMPLVKLFASVLRRAEDGTYLLATPAERGRITVEDAPFVAVELTVAGEGRDQVLTFRTNLDDSVSAGEGHPLRVETDRVTEAPNPYILVRPGLEARLSRPVFYELVEIGREERVGDATLFGIWSQGKFFPLGTLSGNQ